MKQVSFNQLLQKIGLDKFVLFIGIAVLTAYLFPQPGLITSPFSIEDAANIGVSVIFFFYGLKLNIGQLKSDLSNWKMHLVVQSITFLFFPLLILLLRPLFAGTPYEILWMGIFFMATLPSTVSSSVVMVSIAGGNIPSAIFNASISSFIGVFITPLWIGIFIAESTGSFDVSAIIIKLALQVLLPVIIGISLNKKYGAFAERNKNKLKKFDQSIILIIVYTSFCKSFSEHIFENLSMTELFLLMTGMLLLFLIIMSFTYYICKVLSFSGKDMITVLFCGSKKSLIHGTVMAKVLFYNDPMVGYILLPIMLYHALQLICASIIAQKISEKGVPA